MDGDDLRRLALEGLTAFPPTRLGTLGDWLLDFSEASGDARYSSLAQTISTIGDSFGAQSGQTFTNTVQALDAALRQWVPEILDTSDAVDAASLARTLRQEVEEILREDVQSTQQAFRDDLPGTS